MDGYTYVIEAYLSEPQALHPLTGEERHDEIPEVNDEDAQALVSMLRQSFPLEPVRVWRGSIEWEWLDRSKYRRIRARQAALQFNAGGLADPVEA